MADYKTIILQNGDGTIECRYAPFTAQRMDSMLEASEGYRDINAEMTNIINMLTSAPDAVKGNFKDEEEYERCKKLASAYNETNDQTAKDSLTKLLAGKLTSKDRVTNNRIYREYIRTMILETTLEQADLDLVKSDTDSEFWQNQDAYLIKEHGLFFRKQVVLYSE